MTNATQIGDGKISLRYRMVFVFGVIIGFFATFGYALDSHLPQPVKELIKAGLKKA